MQPSWRIYYDDGSTFDSNEGDPEQAPPFGFLFAVGYDLDTGKRYVMHGWDHYCFDRESKQWWGCDIHGLIDRLSRNVVYAYKQGRTVKTSVYKKILNTAINDPDFPLSL